MTGSAVWRGKVQGIWFGIKAWRCGHTYKGFQGAVLPDYGSVLSYPQRNLPHAHILGFHGVPFHCLWTCTAYIKLVACEWWSFSLVWLLQIAISELLKETSVFGAEDLKLKNTFWLKLWALLNTNQPTYLGTTGDLLRLFSCYVMVRSWLPSAVSCLHLGAYSFFRWTRPHPADIWTKHLLIGIFISLLSWPHNLAPKLGTSLDNY